jgi:curved DNA-binding protein CbpA
MPPVLLSSVVTNTMKSFKNYYRVLNIDSTADHAAIKAAFRRLALRYHPDRTKSSRAVRRFREIRAAYEVLSDPAKRRRYDKIYRAQTALRPAAGGGVDPTSIAQARGSSAGLGIALDVLGLKLGLSVDAGVKRRAAPPPKRAPRKSPPRKPST